MRGECEDRKRGDLSDDSVGSSVDMGFIDAIVYRDGIVYNFGEV